MLTRENYHQDTTMLSASQIKTFLECESKFLAAEHEDKVCFVEGNYFEVMLTGTLSEIELFEMQHSYIAPKNAPKGHVNLNTSKGDRQANFLKIDKAIEAIRRQPMLMQIINNAEKQNILTGEISGMPFRMMCDLMLPKSKSIYDLKAMKDFKKVYSEKKQKYVSWWQGYNYDVQLWIYSEIARQNNLYTDNSAYGLIAVSKETIPDIKALLFDKSIFERAEQKVISAIERIKELKLGAEPEPCGTCDWCKANKVITEFNIAEDYE